MDRRSETAGRLFQLRNFFSSESGAKPGFSLPTISCCLRAGHDPPLSRRAAGVGRLAKLPFRMSIFAIHRHRFQTGEAKQAMSAPAANMARKHLSSEKALNSCHAMRLHGVKGIVSWLNSCPFCIWPSTSPAFASPCFAVPHRLYSFQPPKLVDTQRTSHWMPAPWLVLVACIQRSATLAVCNKGIRASIISPPPQTAS